MIIHLSAKCSDCCQVSITDDKGSKVLAEHNGYVPEIIPNEYSDYVLLKIDSETGRILNWETTQEQLDEFIQENKS